MPPKAQPNPAPFGLTPREAEIAMLAWKSLEGDIKINNTKLAAMANIGKPESAGRMWRTVKAKIEAGTAGPAGASTQTTATAIGTNKEVAAGGGKKRGRKDDTGDDADTDADDAEGAEAKAKGGKGGKPKKKVAKRTKVEKQVASAGSENIEDDAEAGEV